MLQYFYLLKLGPASGCSPSPWSSVASCVPSLLAVWGQLPQDERPRIVWAGQGESYIAPPTQLEPRSAHLWDVALIIEYPSKASGSTRVEALVQCVHIFHTQVKARQGKLGAQLAKQASQGDVPKTHTLPGYSRIYKMFEQDPKSGTPVHMVNLLQFVPKSGRQQYNEYVAAATPALGRCGARIAFQTDIIAERNGSSQVQWDSLLIGAYPDKLALLQGVVDPEYMKAFKIRETALSDAMLLATIPIDLATYDARFIKSSL